MHAARPFSIDLPGNATRHIISLRLCKTRTALFDPTERCPWALRRDINNWSLNSRRACGAGRSDCVAGNHNSPSAETDGLCNDSLNRLTRAGSQDIQNEMVAPMIRSRTGVIVVPLVVVHRNAAAGRVPVIQVIVTSLRAFEALGIVNVGIIVKPIPIGRLTAARRLRGGGHQSGRHDDGHTH